MNVRVDMFVSLDNSSDRNHWGLDDTTVACRRKCFKLVCTFVRGEKSYKKHQPYGAGGEYPAHTGSSTGKLDTLLTAAPTRQRQRNKIPPTTKNIYYKTKSAGTTTEQQQ